MTNIKNIEVRVRSIIAEQLGIDENEVKLNSSFIDDLGADSLDVVEIVMALEEEFGSEIPDEDAEKITTALGAINYINRFCNIKEIPQSAGVSSPTSASRSSSTGQSFTQGLAKGAGKAVGDNLIDMFW